MTKNRNYTIPSDLPKDCIKITAKDNYLLRDDINQSRFLCEQMYADDILEDLIHFVHNNLPKKEVDKISQHLKQQERFIND